jgi:hypothetical protein
VVSATPTVDPTSDAAIEAGVQRWVNGLNEASATASMSPLIASATSACACVQDTETSIDYLGSHHLHLTVHYSVGDFKVTDKSETEAAALATITAAPYLVLTSSGSVYRKEPSAHHQNRYSLKRSGDEWIVDTIY